MPASCLLTSTMVAMMKRVDMTAEQSHQPQIVKLDLVTMEAKLSETKSVEVLFKVAYEVRWPSPCTQQWRLDVGLFDVETTEDLEAEVSALGHISQEEWLERYLELGEGGYRVFGEEGAVSSLIESAYMPWSLNKTFGAIKLFIAENSMRLTNACNIDINGIVHQTIPDHFIEAIIGDEWSFSDYQSDKKRWWKKWRLDLDGTSGVEKSGFINLGIPLESLESKGCEIAFFDPELGWQIIDEGHNFRILGRLVEERPRPVLAWSNRL